MKHVRHIGTYEAFNGVVIESESEIQVREMTAEERDAAQQQHEKETGGAWRHVPWLDGGRIEEITRPSPEAP